MGRIDTKAKHRRPVSESAAPSRGQRKRALKKASLIKKIGLTKRVERGINEHKVGTLFLVEYMISHLADRVVSKPFLTPYST